MGIFDRIADRFDQLVAREGDPPGPAEPDPLQHARALLERGELDEAVLAFGRAVDADASQAEAWVGLGEALARLGRFEPSRDAFRRALTLQLPPDRHAYAQGALGRLYAGAGQTQKAIRELRKAVAALPDDAESLAALGRALIGAGEPEGATCLALAGRLWPSRDAAPPAGASLLVEAAGATSDPSAAKQLLREALTRSPDDATIRAALARHLVKTGKIEEARAEAERATEASPRLAISWTALREVHAAAGNFQRALEAARRETEAGSPPPFAVWLGLALGTEERSAIEEALQHGQRGDPDFIEASALADGTLREGDLAALARVAPGGSARRFVVRALAPPPPPAGDLHALLTWVEALATRQPALLALEIPVARAIEAFDRPLLVAVMGEFNVGKSSLVNALAGEEIAPVGITPTTATINVLRYGPGGGRALYHDGTARELAPHTVAPFFNAMTDAEAQSIRQVEIFAPVESLRRVEIVDTPGLNSLRQAHEKVTRDFLLEADAIVWVFAAGQVAKATEREALGLARAAGKHVLGVINKVDGASKNEIEEVVRHAKRELGDLVEVVVPFSARAALASRARDDRAGDRDASALEASGWPALEATLEARFFARARGLKRHTALDTLRRFVADAQAVVTGAPTHAAPTSTSMPHATATTTAPPEERDARPTARAAIALAEQNLRSALATERVELRARLDGAFRAAAFEARELVRPRAWVFSEQRADPEDETFLRDVLDDGTLAATAQTRAALLAAIPAAQEFPTPTLGELISAVEEAVERFRAYARGVIEGAATVFFRIDLPRIRLDAVDIHHALGRWVPDPEEVLFRPLEREIDAFLTRTRLTIDERERADEISNLMKRELLLGPLEALAEVVTKGLP